MALKLFRGRCPFAQPQVEEGDQHRQPPLPRELLRPHSSNGVFSGYVKVRFNRNLPNDQYDASH